MITLVAVSYVGAKYARLGSLIIDEDYSVTGHFANSGGIYEGAEVTYRGVKIGKVGKLTLTPDGVDVDLEITNSRDDIPADSKAIVADRSAVGEQFVELQPRHKGGPYLRDGSAIDRADTEIPLPTDQFLGDLSDTVDSVDQKALSTTVTELGTAFGGTGQDLQQIIDTGTSFVKTAHDNIDVTTNLIKDSNTALKTQMDEESNIKSAAGDLQLFTKTLSGSNKALISLIEDGAASSSELRTFLEQNKVDLAQLIREVAKTGEIVSQNLAGVKQVLVVYPNVVEPGFAVVSKDPGTGLYNSHFGMVITTQSPCTKGYEGTTKHSPIPDPSKSDDYKINSLAHCTEKASAGDARGYQNLKNRAPVASYDSSTGKVSWGDPSATSGSADAPATYGDDSWKWLYLSPMTADPQN